MSLTTDPKHPGLGRGVDEAPRPQQDVYPVLSAEEIAKGYLKPFRTGYRHETCGALTTMGHQLSATYARDPFFYGATYCTGCSMHRPLSEFRWTDGEPMDPRKWPQAEHERIADRRELTAPQPINGHTLAQVIADLEAGALIEPIGRNSQDDFEYQLALRRYKVADTTLDKLLKRRLIEPCADGWHYRKAAPQTAAAALQSAPPSGGASPKDGDS